MEANGITRANFTEVLRVLEFGKEIIKIYAQTLDKKKLRVFTFRKDEEIKIFDLVTTLS